MPDRTLPPIRPSAALQASYDRKLRALLDEMNTSVVYWLKAAYRANEPEIANDGHRSGGVSDIHGDALGRPNEYDGCQSVDWGRAAAADASPATELRRAIARLRRRWLKRFDEAAPDLARYFATAAADRTDAALKAALHKAGYSISGFKLTAAQNDVLQATVNENVALIKSIAQQHLTQVEGMVMRSVQVGRDLGTLSKELQAQFGVTKRRAAFIARDQNNKATATLTRARQTELGITQAKWLHSAGGKHPRPEHVAASGKIYDVNKGMYLEGKWTFPGVEINCRCVAVSVVPGF